MIKKEDRIISYTAGIVGRESKSTKFEYQLLRGYIKGVN